ncbi:MAG: hypothetical protein ACOYN0_18125 [Phycisphaerales bacterium]
MRRRDWVRPLVFVNVALAVAIGATVASRPVAIGQTEPAASARRPRGEYTLVSAKTNQGGPYAVWVLDAANNEMLVLRWEQSRQTLVGAGYRNLSTDSRQPLGR